jgi:hypothetical protein
MYGYGYTYLTSERKSKSTEHVRASEVRRWSTPDGATHTKEGTEQMHEIDLFAILVICHPIDGLLFLHR